MINPNATSKHYGRVIQLSRSHNGSLNVQVLLESGHMVEELGFIYHKTLMFGDLVACTIGFSIMSDQYGIRGITKITPKNKLFSRVELRVGRQNYFTANRANLKAVSHE